MTWQPDIAQNEVWQRGPQEPLGRVLDKLRNYADKVSLSRTMSAPVKNTPFVKVWPEYTGTPADTFLNSPQILVPANKNRISLVAFQLSFEDNAFPFFAACYSWGYPAMAPVVGVGRTYGGILVPGYCVLNAGVVHHLGVVGNGTISEDALWITFVKVRNAGAVNFNPGFVIAYEGTLAIEAPRNRRAA